MTKNHLFGLTPPDLEALLQRQGVAASPRATRQVLSRVISEDRAGEVDNLDIPRIVRDAVAALPHERLEVVERALDEADGFLKLLLRAADGALFEAVRIPLAKPGRYTVCLSSQVGCAMKCDFCATGRLGLSRNLLASEMVGAFIAVRDTLAPGARLTGAVFMGQGEPFHNFDEVVQAARVLSDPCGGRIHKESITISTVGLLEPLRRYTREGHPYRLIVSLHSALPERRRRLLPVAGRTSIEDLALAIREHAAATEDRVTVAWTLMAGVNHDEDEVAALTALFAGVPLRFNLIDVNDAREGGYRRATDDERHRFMDALQVLAVPIVRRYSGGAARHAACGMLAATRFPNARPAPA